MKKGLIAGAALTAAALLITPHFVGHSIEQDINQLIDNINKAPGYQAESLRHNRLWFSSQGAIRITFGGQMFANMPGHEPVSFDVEYAAEHGPLLFNAQGPLAWASFWASVDADQLPEEVQLAEGEPFYLSEGNISLAGTINMHDVIPRFSVETDDMLIEFGGFEGRGALGNTLDYQGSAGLISVSSEQGNFSLDKITVNLDLENNWQNGLTLSFAEGSQQVALHNIRFSSEVHDQQVSIESLNLDTLSEKVSDELNRVAFTYALNNLQANDFSMNKAIFTMSLGNLHNDVLDGYSRLIEDMQNLADPDDLPKPAQDYLNDILGALVKHQPSLNIDELSFVLPAGEFNGHLNAELVGVDALPDPLNDQAFWLQHVSANGKVSMDVTLANYLGGMAMRQQLADNPQFADMSEDQQQAVLQQQVNGGIQMLVAQGMLEQTDEKLISNLTFKDSILTINQQQIPLGL